MRPLFETITELQSGEATVRCRRSGILEVEDERLTRIRFRPWAKRASWLEARLLGRLEHRCRRGNVCRLYFNQPRAAPGFLALSYVVSTRDTTLATFRKALRTLDEIARLKGSDAILCDVSNARISDRLLKRWGWAPLEPRFGHRNYIKRFYGVYPSPDAAATTLIHGRVAVSPAVHSAVLSAIQQR